jgi:REP element-mobilizing transposase RayT
MARPLRIEYPDAWYHVMNRGAGRRCIFPDDFLRQEFLSLLRDIHRMYSVDCHAYCQMGNHYHLLLQTRRANLGRAMRHLDGIYAQRHNRHVKIDGPLFRGRYKGQLIERDSYLFYVSRYVHRNPLTAGLCERAIDYPWSSYRYYAGMRPVPSWLHLDETIVTFGSAKAYCAFVDKNGDDGRYDDLAELLGGDAVPPVLGSPAFVDAIQRQYCAVPDYEIPQSKARVATVTVDEIIDTVSAFTSIPRQEIIIATRQRARTARAMAMLLCRQCGGFKLRDIADAFGVKQYTTVASAISRCRNQADNDLNLARELDALKQAIQKMRNA